MDDLMQKAIEFATEKHKLQRRTGGEPYVNHCLRVMNTVKYTFDVNDNSILLAAVLHDTVEDTETTLEDITKEFGTEVAQLVDELTNKYSDHLPHEEKLKATVEHVSHMSQKAKYVKVADRYDNITDFVGWKLARRLRYAENTIAMLQALQPVPVETNEIYNKILKICTQLLEENKEV